jgi:PTS system beta-glucosides-specific IIC component
MIALSEVEDEAFSNEELGKGCAIKPTNGKVYAPCDGEVTVLFPTGHAIGITSNNGAQVMIHIGVNTVNLDGKGFDSKVKQGDKVSKGDLLSIVDLDFIKKSGYSTTTPIFITNTNKYNEVITMPVVDIKVGDDLIEVM